MLLFIRLNLNPTLNQPPQRALSLPEPGLLSPPLALHNVPPPHPITTITITAEVNNFNTAPTPDNPPLQLPLPLPPLPPLLAPSKNCFRNMIMKLQT
ncbi:uncharacterized protein ColSpa_04293 [Colletotrichum spaethianum]|uniref:Uncharacterized protein n=1 Tax=Colletotrichum spaethianum TaxID=700344 RepID=A0AA37LHB3_9PEZI|nr:uncharacterized protein ColSpa_04293 [Colletotrichum spaethianum]GKT44112.1 hypothetical protein ColSpa_04293 [Colletotrichum spaethianum]